MTDLLCLQNPLLDICLAYKQVQQDAEKLVQLMCS